MRFISLSLCLFGFWLALSGHYSSFLIATGLASALLAAVVAWRMGAIDAEGHPIHLLPAGLFYYFPWLLWKIIQGGCEVAMIIMRPDLPISPTLTNVKALQATSVGVAIFGNSITLIPGTYTIAVNNGTMLTVHCLEDTGADNLVSGELPLNRKVRAFEELAGS